MSYSDLTTAPLEEIFKEGKQRGNHIGSWVDMPQAGDVLRIDGERIEIIDAASLEQAMLSQAYANESHGRDCSPFEYIAHAINERSDSEAAWEQYQAGIDAGIKENIESRIAAVGDAWFEED